MEAEEDKKPTLTLTIFTFPSVFTNEGDEDLPKSGIRSPGRGEEELGSVQITQEMVNKSLGELKLTQSIREQMATCVRGFYQAGEAMTGQDFSPVHSLEMGKTGTRELQQQVDIDQKHQRLLKDPITLTALSWQCYRQQGGLSQLPKAIFFWTKCH